MPGRQWGAAASAVPRLEQVASFLVEGSWMMAGEPRFGSRLADGDGILQLRA
jgi:hypothetical protein